MAEISPFHQTKFKERPCHMVGSFAFELFKYSWPIIPIDVWFWYFSWLYLIFVGDNNCWCRSLQKKILIYSWILTHNFYHKRNYHILHLGIDSVALWVSPEWYLWPWWQRVGTCNNRTVDKEKQCTKQKTWHVSTKSFQIHFCCPIFTVILIDQQ